MSYDFLWEMAWKSAAISAAALAVVTLLRSRSAADRGAVLRIGVLLLLSLPVIAALFPALVIETAAPAAAPFDPGAAAMPAAAPLAAAPVADSVAASAVTTASSDWNDPGSLFLLLYLGGLAMVGGRLLAGLLTLGRWTREARDVTDPHWLAALQRISEGRRPIRLLVSHEAVSPLSWGWLRPVILLDADTLDRPEDADAILAHEVAHVLRNDWPSLMLSRLTVALFWFNPLVWRLDREIAQQAEEAADGFAAERVEPARYAQTLLDWARQNGGFVPANAMAGSEPGLSRRVKALLDGRFRRRSSLFWSVSAMAAVAAVAAPVAALEFVPRAPEAPAAPEAPLAPAASGTPLAPEAPAAPPAPLAAKAPAAQAAPRVPGAPLAPLAPPVQLAALHPHGPEAPHAPVPPRPPHPPLVDADAIAAQVEAAVAEAHRSADVIRAHAVARIDAKAIERDVRRAVRIGLSDGARNMRHGADGMDHGAANMAQQAARLRDRRVREQEIARARARGHTLTHEELLEASEELAEGAREMREAAKEMRRDAKEMADGG
ncbi:MAG TPA: M56 family metallopeptidase [Allosphingosinicella sp.]|jgi:beta-lactamase regulating signal transducer with metallopeptidase domain